jgi:hypothetical protein
MTFMQEFRPRPATTSLHDALALELDQLDRRIKTSNNIPSKTLAEHLMVLLLGMHQWITAQGQDIADYAQAIAASVEGGGEPPTLDDEEIGLLAAVCEHLEATQKLFDEYKSIMPENALKLGEHNKELLEALTGMVEEHTGEEEVGEGEEDDDLFDTADAEVTK